MTDETTEQGRSVEEICRGTYEPERAPVLVVNPANVKIVYANPAFDALVKPGMLDEPRGKLSDILKHGLQSDFRERMIDAIKEPEEPKEGEIHLREDLFIAESHGVRLSHLPIGETDYIEIRFTAGANAPAQEESGDAAALRRRVAELEQESAAKDLMYHRFAHLIGHELKAPLTALKGYSELLEYQFRESGDAETREILDMIVRACGRLHRSIDAMYHVGVQDMLDRRYKTADLQKVLAATASELEEERGAGGHAFVPDRSKARLKTNPVVLQEALYQISLFELLQAKQPGMKIHIRYAPEGEWYAFMLRVSAEAEEEMPQNVADLIESLRPPADDRRATTIGYAVAAKLIEQTGGRTAIERGSAGVNSYYLLLPKAN